MMPQMMKNSREMIVTLKSLGMAENSAWIPIFRPLFLLTTLSGLRILRSLKILTILNLFPEITKLAMDMMTTMKSMAFHPFLR